LIVTKLNINNLRNHISSKIEFSNRFNLIHGQNGSGKTTILEALSILCLSKSFLPTNDKGMIRHGVDYYYLSLSAIKDNSLPYSVDISYQAYGKKKIKNTYSDNLTPKNIIGEIPNIVLSPDFKNITFGSPQDRREFIDRMLSQVSRTYYEDLINYKKALKQKNSLLSLAKRNPYFDYSQIEPWNEILLDLASKLIIHRKNLIEEFKPYFISTYQGINSNDEVNIRYFPHSIELERISEFKEVREILLNYYNEHSRTESYKLTSCFGPQKDDLRIEINGGLARETASQGQHKTLLISLKFSEFYYMKSKLNETPIILFDDIFSELDEERSQKVIELLSSTNAQVFITGTNLGSLSQLVDKRYFNLTNGEVNEID